LEKGREDVERGTSDYSDESGRVECQRAEAKKEASRGAKMEFPVGVGGKAETSNMFTRCSLPEL
jgi:hypothetical protein